MILETERLFLREMNMNDLHALYAVLADPEIMRHYPYSFDEHRVREWIGRNMDRYREYGFGLWAVCLKETGEMIGDCGLTLQPIDGEMLPEIGYHIRRDCQRKGYAREAALAVRDWAFRNTDHPAVYSYCKYTNIPSIRTAESIGMRFEKEYPDDANGITHVSAITRVEWQKTELSGIRIRHPFGPLFSPESRVLILGSFPSVKSREQQFFYGHPQNRFWKVIAALYNREPPVTINEKKELILSHRLALWDSIASCVITGSSDASIRDVRPNDLRIILDHCPIGRICCNGRKSYEMYERYIMPETGREALCLPSTSPANAQWSLERLIAAWSVIRE